MSDHQEQSPLLGSTGDARRRAAQADRNLVDRCLAGDQFAWETLYRECHPALVDSVKILLRSYAADEELAEEIAARIWYLVVQDDGDLLNRFDAERDARLSAYLAALARYQVLTYFRSERRRHARESNAKRIDGTTHAESEGEPAARLDEFLATLSAREREFLDWCLCPPDAGDCVPFSPTGNSDSQMRFRLRQKIHDFFRPE